MNPQLERALVQYYQRQRRRGLLLIIACAAELVLTLLWVVIVKPSEGFHSRSVMLFGIPGALGLLFFSWGLASHRAVLLERMRTGIPIQRVRRGTTPLKSTSDVPTIYVEFADGRTSPLYALGDAQQMWQIEQLLRLEMTTSGERGHRV